MNEADADRSQSPGLSSASPHGALGALHTTLGAGLLLQGLAAVASFVVVPILVSALGSARFGVLTVIMSFGPWLIVIDTGLQASIRLLSGEFRGAAQGRAPAALLRRGKWFAACAMALNAGLVLVAAFALPLDQLLGIRGVVSTPELVTALMAFAVVIIISSPGAVILGALEGVGRTVVAASLAGAGPIVGLPLSALVVHFGGGLVELALVQGLAVAIPRYAALLYWRWRPSTIGGLSTKDAGLRPILVGQLTLLAVLSLAQTGLAPAIVSGILGADAAGSYGIGWRLVTGALVPLLVLTPFFTGALAAARGGGWNRSHDRALFRLLGQAGGAGALAGSALLLLGPIAVSLLGRGEVPVSNSILLAGAVFLLTTYVAAPLQAAFAGPKALRASVVVGVVVTVLAAGLSLWFTPRLGAAGPLWAASVAAVVTTLFWIVVWRLRPSLLGEAHVAAPGDPS